MHSTDILCVTAQTLMTIPTSSKLSSSLVTILICVEANKLSGSNTAVSAAIASEIGFCALSYS